MKIVSVATLLYLTTIDVIHNHSHSSYNNDNNGCVVVAADDSSNYSIIGSSSSSSSSSRVTTTSTTTNSRMNNNRSESMLLKINPRKNGFYMRNERNYNDLDLNLNEIQKDDSMQSMELRAGAQVLGSLLSKERLGVGFFIVVDHLLRKVFKKSGISFPSQLAGCLILFVLMVIGNVVSSFPVGDQVFDMLSPGAAWLAKWLPVMFVPGLVMVPLAPSVGSSVELLKIAVIIVAGFVLSLLSTAYSVVLVRSIQGTLVSERVATDSSSNVASTTAAKPFSDELVKKLTTSAIVSACLAVAPISAIEESGLVTTFTTISHLTGTLAGYVWGARLPPSFTKMVHPLVTSSVVALIQAQIMGMLSGKDLKSMVLMYKSSSFAWNAVGAGDLLLYALGPAVFSLAIAMYSRKNLMAENLAAVLTAGVVSSVVGIFSTAFAARLLNVASPLVRLSIISRSVTTPLAIAITNMLDGDIPIACVVVVLTGIFGVSVWSPVLNYFGIADPVARGLSVGASAQGVGVASIADEKDAFPFAAINMVMIAVFSTVLVSIPSVRDLVIKILSDN